MNFTFPAYRDLKQYLGKMDAMVEVTELAARHLVSGAQQHGNAADFIKELAEAHGVSVNYSEFDKFQDHLAQTYIVIVFQSAERFFYNFRRQHIELFQKQWAGGKDNTLEIVLKNLSDTAEISRRRIGKDLVTRFEYYYRIRNWASHPREDLKPKALKAFGDIVEWEEGREESFGALNAPNAPDELSFDDFIVFSRICKEIAFKMCTIKTLSAEHIGDSVMKRFARLQQNPKRQSVAIASYLSTEYGLDRADADYLTKEILTH